MEKFQPHHWEQVKQGCNIDTLTLVQQCVKFHSPLDDDADTKIVGEFFNSFTGNFLCCGSNNGVDQSFQLLERGWTGVYVEPDPYACIELIKETSKYKDQVKILNVAIFPDTGIKRFNIATSSSWCSSGKDGWAEEHGVDSSVIQPIFVNAVTLTDIMEWLDYKVDYVQTDLEGFDIQVINSFDWSLATSCKMICTEAGHAVLQPLCRQGDFMITDITGTNSFYKKKEFLL